MSEEYAIHWLEPLVNKIIKRKQTPIVMSAGKTPSGHVHLGFMREVIIGDALRRLLKRKRKKVIFRIFFDSYDAAKRFPPYIPNQYSKKYIGQPFALIPSPFDDIQADSYAEYFGKELANTFPSFGINIDLIWTHKLYQQDEMQEKLRIGLKKSNKAKEILLSHLTHAMNDQEKKAKYEYYKNWMPAMVVCENCGRTQIKNEAGEILPNRVLKFDQKSDSVSYSCPACEYSGEVSLSSGFVKIGWRLDWPAKWSMNPKNVYEGSGKDHFTKITGSWDVAVDLCKNIYGYEGPVGLGFEWMRLGDTDMGTSKGVVFMPKTYLSMAEPELLRMIVLTTNPSRHISFRIEELSLLYDDFERLERIYYEIEEPFDVQKKIEEHKTRLRKELRKDLEKAAAKDISEKIRNEKNIEKRKQLAKQKKAYIKNQVEQQYQIQFDEQIRNFSSTEQKEFSRQIQEVQFLYPLIRAKRIRKQCPPQIPHKFLVNMVQLRKFITFDEILKKAQQTQDQKRIETKISKTHLRKRLRQTQNWIAYMKDLIQNASSPEEKTRLENKVDLFDVPKKVTSTIVNQLNSGQKYSLEKFSLWLNTIEELNEKSLKKSMIKIRNNTGISAQELFQAIYMVLIGTPKGPRLGPLITLMDLDWVKERFSIFSKK